MDALRVDLRVEHVGGQVDVDGPARSGLADAEGLGNRARRRAWDHGSGSRIGRGAHQLDLVHLLEASRALLIAWPRAAEGDDRHLLPRGVADGRDHIRDRRSGRCEADAGSGRDSCVGLGGRGSGLLVAHAHESDAARLAFARQVDIRRARDVEDRVDAMVVQSSCDEPIARNESQASLQPGCCGRPGYVPIPVRSEEPFGIGAEDLALRVFERSSREVSSATMPSKAWSGCG